MAHITEDTALLVHALERLARGEASLADLAGALRETPHLVTIIPPAEGVRFLTDLDDAVKAKGIGNVTTRDGEPPRIVGTTTDQGFVPRLFTSDALATEHATARGLIEPGDVLMSQHRTPGPLLVESLNQRHGGWVIDEGTEHALTLDREGLARLYALATLEEFARQPALSAITRSGRLVERSPEGELVAFVFDSPRTAAQGLPDVRARVPDAGVQESAVLPLLTALLQQGVSRLFVNIGFTTVRWYTREELERMVALLGGDVAATAPRAGDPALEATGGDLAAGAPASPAAGEAAARARRYPVPAMVPPPGRADDGSQQAFKVLWERVQKDRITIWEYVRLLAHDLDLYVQLLARPARGATWPQPFRDAKEPEKSLLHTYTREDRMRAAMASDPPEERRFQRLAGVELMRWLWAAPKTVDDVYVNAYKGSEGFLRVPARWALSVIYPHYLDVESLDAVPAPPLPRLAALPGAGSGLHAEIVKALVQGWKHLLGTKARDGGPARPVERAGGRWLPAFTTDDQFFALGSADRSFDALPVRADAQPPFGRWLAAARDCDGIVLDPAAPRPLTLDHTDLLLLDLWSRLGVQPRGPELAKTVAGLSAEGAITPGVAARIVADWPEWYVGVQRSEATVAVLTMPDRDALPIFASPDAVGAYVAHHRTAGRLRGSWEAVGVVHRWAFSVFDQVRESYRDGACIAPAADGSGGLAVDAAMLEAAMQRLHERLTPRVPGFVAEA